MFALVAAGGAENEAKILGPSDIITLVSEPLHNLSNASHFLFIVIGGHEKLQKLSLCHLTVLNCCLYCLHTITQLESCSPRTPNRATAHLEETNPSSLLHLRKPRPCINCI
jgi:hypothetical protein